MCAERFYRAFVLFHNFSECPEEFVRNIYEQQCYMLVEERLSWHQAEEYCRSKNAYLAELIETAERDAVWNYIRGIAISEHFEANCCLNVYNVHFKFSSPISR